jgi:hypothetical protein
MTWLMGEEIGAVPNPALRAKPRLPLPGGAVASFGQDGPNAEQGRIFTETIRRNYGSRKIFSVVFRN